MLLEYGPMSRIISDRGSQFMSQVFKALAEASGVKHAPSTSYHPQTNGLTERFNHTLCVMLSMYVHDNQGDWDLFLPFVQYAYRDTPHTSTGYSPFELLRTYSPRPLVDFKFPDVSLELLTSSKNGLEAIKERIKNMHADVSNRLKLARERQTEYYNLNRRDVSYELGERVWFYWPARGVDAPKLKLSIPWSGPYWIKEIVGPVNYRLMKPDGTTLKQTVHVDRLKPCTSVLGTPKEFVSLHENDSFDPAVERGEKQYVELPVMREITNQVEDIVPVPDPNFVDIPMTDHEPILSDSDIIRKIIDESGNIDQLEALKASLTKRREEMNNNELKPLIKDVKRRIHDIHYPKVENKVESVKEKLPQFYSENIAPNPPVEIPKSEFIETWNEPLHKKELYNALVDVYVQYRDKDPSLNIAPVKKELKNIFTSPNITGSNRIRNFARQITALKNHDEFIDFLRTCLANFEETFDVEIQDAQRRR